MKTVAEEIENGEESFSVEALKWKHSQPRRRHGGGEFESPSVSQCGREIPRLHTGNHHLAGVIMTPSPLAPSPPPCTPTPLHHLPSPPQSVSPFCAPRTWKINGIAASASKDFTFVCAQVQIFTVSHSEVYQLAVCVMAFGQHTRRPLLHEEFSLGLKK